MSFRAFLALSLTLLAASSRPSEATQALTQPRSPASVVIVELFTSEGCSSCPPADALLRQIHLKQTSSGQLIVGLSEHVTYWNSLSWKDPYSQQVFTDRQGIYASRLSPEGPYTPQMVLNGRDQFVGSNSGALEEALRKDALRKHADLKIVSATRRGDGFDLSFSLDGTASRALDILSVFTDDADHSNVLRGENSGRSLEHVSVARSLARVATVKGDTEQSVHLALPAGFHDEGDSGHHLVLFAQERNQGAIVAAVVMSI